MDKAEAAGLLQVFGKTENSYLHFEGSVPEWYISTMLYSQDIPFWSRILDLPLMSKCSLLLSIFYARYKEEKAHSTLLVFNGMKNLQH